MAAKFVSGLLLFVFILAFSKLSATTVMAASNNPFNLDAARYGGLSSSQYCSSECNRRCGATHHKSHCVEVCKDCCSKCHCVPPGTLGNKDKCPCYRDMKTQENKPKCP